MKIATYNIRTGGKGRVHWAKLIEEQGGDLLLAQESAAPDQHLPSSVYPQFHGQSVWEMVGTTGWGSAVFSRTGSVTPISVPGFSGWVVGAEITGAAWQAGLADPIMVFSVHAPKRGETYQKQVNKLLDEISQIASGRGVIIGGDFNLTVSNCIGPVRPLDKQDLAIQMRLADEFGLLNCWQAANPGQPLHQTLRWMKNQTIPFHCDGIFVPKSWKERLRSCEVLAGDEWIGLSDHNPIVATFQ